MRCSVGCIQKPSLIFGYFVPTKSFILLSLIFQANDNNHENLTPGPDNSSSVDSVSHWFLVLSTSLGLIILGIFLGFVLHRERFVISYKLLSTWHRLNHNQSKKMSETNEKTYDIFISYAYEDDEWVTSELLPKLEITYGFKACVHERDFRIGVTVMQNIVQCVDESRVFLAVLTPAYVNSTWCMFELFLAQARMAKLRHVSLKKLRN